MWLRNMHKMFQIVPCMIYNISGHFHKNAFMYFFRNGANMHDSGSSLGTVKQSSLALNWPARIFLCSTQGV